MEIPFPGGDRHLFTLHRCSTDKEEALASVIKNAGDDPDVTNGAEIGARCRRSMGDAVVLLAGPGVGRVTKPGLPVAVGEPAINPVPRQMIQAAIREALADLGWEAGEGFELEIFVTNGEELATRTLNRRLGIVGGLSILGTTGIVRPLSTRAWTETIESSMRVARANGLEDVLLSTGRTSEAAVQKLLALPEEAQVMMGDYLRYSLEAAHRHGFSRIHLAMMWGKMVKAALAVPQTHVRHGDLVPADVGSLLIRLGLDAAQATRLAEANTARQIFEKLREEGQNHIINRVINRAREQAEQWAGSKVRIYLVTAQRQIFCGGGS